MLSRVLGGCQLQIWRRDKEEGRGKRKERETQQAMMTIKWKKNDVPRKRDQRRSTDLPEKEEDAIWQPGVEKALFHSLSHTHRHTHRDTRARM